ncbi:tetratricopeptide repeat protein, partial [Aphanizomenon sp. PH219]|nr:tetratricopeptide repeat protein [Aphanizomenon sp. PH219]
SLNNLAGLYESQGRYNDAEPLYLQSLDIRKRQLGDDHPDVASSLNNLAGLYESQGKYSEAENLAKQATLPAFNTETALTLLEKIENNPELLSSIQESLQQQTDASDDNT